MATSSIHADNEVTRFQRKARKEYVRGGPFGAYIGNDENSIIQTNRSLKKISIPLIAKVGGAGVKGSSQLRGQEQQLSNYAQVCTPEHRRQGVLIDNEENEKAEFDLFSEARPSLNNWMQELKRDQIIQALGAVHDGTTYHNYGGTEGATGAGAATAANMDSWVTNNTDRILYGSAKSNLTSGDHTTSLATIDTTNDKLTAASLTLAKRMAKNARPHIRPFQVGDDMSEWFVYFCGSYSFRDIKTDATVTQANREARARGLNNPIFQDGDLLYDGIIIKELNDLDVFIDAGDTDSAFNGVWGANATGDSLLTGGDSSSRVGVGFMCGAQAIAFVIGKMARFNRASDDDYGFLQGVAITAKHDIKKTFYNKKQHGMLTHFHSAAADA